MTCSSLCEGGVVLNDPPYMVGLFCSLSLHLCIFIYMIRLKSLMSKLMELDEERKFPHLNPKLSIPDTVLKFAERDDTFISFRALLKSGLNPTSPYDTPLGIFMYPAKMALEKYGKSDEFGIKFPFATGYPFVYFIIKKPNIKELNIDTYTKQDGDRDMDKLIKIYSPMFGEDTLNKLKTSDQNKHKNVPVGQFWYFCYKLSEMLQSEKGGKSSVYWTKMLKTDLGYDLVIDSGNGVIHSNEPCQAFFTSENAFTINTVIEKSNVVTSINYEKIANNPKALSIFLGDRINKLTDDNVSNLLSRSRDSQKTIDILLSKNITLTDNNVDYLLHYSTDKEKTIDVLLSKGLSIDKILTDRNVSNLLFYSTDPQKTIDILLSKNITLTDLNVSNLLIYSTDKEKTIDVLLSKNVPLTDRNVNYLLSYSPDKQDTQQKIDMLKVKQKLSESKSKYTDYYKYLNESIVKRVDIENLLPDKNNMEVAVDSLRKGMQSPSNSPIEVYASEDKYIVADGHHRLLQAIINGESSVNVKVLDSEKPISRNGTVVLDFLDGDYYGLDNNLESGWLIKRL